MRSCIMMKGKSTFPVDACKELCLVLKVVLDLSYTSACMNIVFRRKIIYVLVCVWCRRAGHGCGETGVSGTAAASAVPGQHHLGQW